MTESILNSIKKMLGIASDYTHFDLDIMAYINSVFFVIAQLGVGPSSGFTIDSALITWEDFADEINGYDRVIPQVRTYMYLKVKMLFDPPTSPSVIESMNRMLAEHESRLNMEMSMDPIEEPIPEPIIPQP